MTLEVNGGATEASAGGQRTVLELGLPLPGLPLVIGVLTDKNFHLLFLQYELVYFSVALCSCCPKPYILAIQSLKVTQGLSWLS